MQTFLEQVTEHILSRYPDSTGDLCVVTPNRRAGLFFRKYFATRIRKAMWAPEVMSVEDFINKISAFTIGDTTGLVLEFYTVYKGMEGDEADDLEQFLSWAPALLRDFDEIDNAMVDTGKLYDYLEDIRYIDTWNPDGSELTPFQQNYLAFIKKLRYYHQALADHLAAKKVAWQGLSSRRAATMIGEGQAELPWQHIVFTGFNALSPAEEQIIHSLLRDGRADYLTDGDPYYVDDPQHEAGRFLRKYQRLFGLPSPSGESHFMNKEKEIRILGVARNVNQARLAGNLLAEDAASEVPGTAHPGQDPPGQTAVVLANENLLIPLLNALPDNCRQVNVTMGYPLSNTNMFGFFHILFQLQLTARRSGEGRKAPLFYHRDLCRLFSHSNSRLLWGEEKAAGMIQWINESNQGFYSFKALQEQAGEGDAFSQAFAFLGMDWQDRPAEMFPLLREVIAGLDKAFREKAGQAGGDVVNTPFFVDFESLYYFARLFRRLEAFVKDYQVLGSLKMLSRLVKQFASETRLSFSGEPLSGLQVMGMLETRSLDFEHVILLSANENILPKPKSQYSFIPYEVKRLFGLRLHHDQDAIYAYHFYRLLQRARRVSIIYNTQSDDLGSNEKSRFIVQLQHELAPANPAIRITEEIVSLPPPRDHGQHEITIPKTPGILNDLADMAQRGFSPSALTTYINCPLQFYFERLARMEEVEEVEETMDARTLGNVVHGVLEDLFSPLVGKVLKAVDVEGMSGLLDKTLAGRFSSEYSKGQVSSGKNLLMYHLCRRFLENVLKAEQKALKEAAQEDRVITLVALEEKMGAWLELPQDGEDTARLRIHGKADRIDRLGDVVRVIDYKTGQVGPYELNFKEWDAPLVNRHKAKNFQLLCYAWLYHKNHPEALRIEPGIISTRSTSRGIHRMKHPGGQSVLGPQELGTFEGLLSELCAGLMDPGQPFRQTEEADRCRYCHFIRLCRRWGA